MEEDFNWNLASNAQLKEECGRLEKLFEEKQSKFSLANLRSKRARNLS